MFVMLKRWELSPVIGFLGFHPAILLLAPVIIRPVVSVRVSVGSLKAVSFIILDPMVFVLPRKPVPTWTFVSSFGKRASPKRSAGFPSIARGR